MSAWTGPSGIGSSDELGTSGPRWKPAVEPGVTELRLHPAVDSPELRAITGDWASWVDDHALVCDEPTLKDAVDAAGITLVGYRQLRRLVRQS